MGKRISIKAKSLFFILKNPRLLPYNRKSLLLNTIPKSGTNFLRLILTNYFCNYNRINQQESLPFQKIGYFEMHQSIFPNVRSDLLNGAKPFVPNKIDRENLIYNHYSDFMYDHGHSIDFLCKNKWISTYLMSAKMILLYRNPLDQIVSWYFYEYINKRKMEVDLDDILDTLIRNYSRHYYRTKLLHSVNPEQTFLVSYEELISKPLKKMVEILSFLELPVDEQLINLCINASSRKAVQKEESEKGTTIHSNSLSVKSFIRSGDIGDWKNYLSGESFKKA